MDLPGQSTPVVIQRKRHSAQEPCPPPPPLPPYEDTPSLQKSFSEIRAFLERDDRMRHSRHRSSHTNTTPTDASGSSEDEAEEVAEEDDMDDEPSFVRVEPDGSLTPCTFNTEALLTPTAASVRSRASIVDFRASAWDPNKLQRTPIAEQKQMARAAGYNVTGWCKPCSALFTKPNDQRQ